MKASVTRRTFEEPGRFNRELAALTSRVRA